MSPASLRDQNGPATHGQPVCMLCHCDREWIASDQPFPRVSPYRRRDKRPRRTHRLYGATIFEDGSCVPIQKLDSLALLLRMGERMRRSFVYGRSMADLMAGLSAHVNDLKCPAVAPPLPGLIGGPSASGYGLRSTGPPINKSAIESDFCVGTFDSSSNILTPSRRYVRRWILHPVVVDD